MYIENRTDRTAAILENGTRIDWLAASETGDYAILKFEGTLTYEVRTLDGNALASRTFTWEEIHKEDGITLIVE